MLTIQVIFGYVLLGALITRFAVLFTAKGRRVDSQMQKRKTMKNDEQIGIDIPEELQDAFEEIVGLTDEFCREHLNEEYRQLCSDMAIELAELEAPINKGRPASWACGIVHALGFVNFLHDPSQSPHMTSPRIAEGFGVSHGTMQSKSKIVRDELDLIQLDPDWCLPALLDDNPLVWMLEIDGFVMDMHMAPREAQEQAYRQGLIPYVPADRKQAQFQSDSQANIIQFPSGPDEPASAKSSNKPKDDGPNLFDGLAD